MTRLLQDLRLAVRLMVKKPGVTLVAALSLALGIGANIAVFSIADALILQELPVRNPQELVLLRWTSDQALSVRFGGWQNWSGATEQGLSTSTSFPARVFHAIQQRSQAFESLFAFAEMSGVALTQSEQVEAVEAQAVSGGYFRGIGLSPWMGRNIGPRDDRPDAAAAAVLSHAFWKRRFGSQPSAVGSEIQLNGAVFTVVGVTPPGFNGALQAGSRVDVSIPLAHVSKVAGHNFAAVAEEYVSPQRSGQELLWWLQIMGRLTPGISRDTAKASLDVILRQEVTPHLRPPEGSGRPLSSYVLPAVELDSGARGQNELRQRMAPRLMLMAGVGLLVLLIPCANVAVLSLARAGERSREMAVRLAAGARRIRLFRQLLTESALLSCLGGVLGLAIGYWIRDPLIALLPSSGSNAVEIQSHADLRTLVFAAAVSLFSGLLCGLAPAASVSAVSPMPVLRGGGRTGQRSRRRLLGRTLVAAQVALSVSILAAAGLFLGTLRNLTLVELGFNPDKLVLFDLKPTETAQGPRNNLETYRQVLIGLRSEPGISSASYSRHAVLGGYYSSNYLAQGDGPGRSTLIHYVGTGFFRTLELPLRTGRVLQPQDFAAETGAAVINEALAERLFENRNPLGESVQLGRGSTSRPLQIVGVVGDSVYDSLRRGSAPTLYLPYAWTSVGATFAVRGLDSGSDSQERIRSIVRDAAADIVVENIRSQPSQVASSLSRERQFAALFSSLGFMALALSCIGLYGTLSHHVAGRRREFGIRLALGAQRSSVVGLAMREMLPVAAGAAAGAFAAAGLSRFLSSALFGLTPSDPTTLIGAALVMLTTAAGAAYLPARRAGQVDPAASLRCD